MRTLKFIFALLAVGTLVSCEQNYRNSEESNWYVEEFDIRARDWRLVGDPDAIGSYYEYTFSLDNFTMYNAYDKGVMTAYLYRGDRQLALPYTFYMVDSDDYGNDIYYSVYYACEFSDDAVTFKIYVSDYYTSLLNLNDEHFRIALVW
jgi:hypothetical protein